MPLPLALVTLAGTHLAVRPSMVYLKTLNDPLLRSPAYQSLSSLQHLLLYTCRQLGDSRCCSGTESCGRSCPRKLVGEECFVVPVRDMCCLGKVDVIAAGGPLECVHLVPQHDHQPIEGLSYVFTIMWRDQSSGPVYMQQMILVSGQDGYRFDSLVYSIERWWTFWHRRCLRRPRDGKGTQREAGSGKK